MKQERLLGQNEKRLLDMQATGGGVNLWAFLLQKGDPPKQGAYSQGFRALIGKIGGDVGYVDIPVRAPTAEAMAASAAITLFPAVPSPSGPTGALVPVGVVSAAGAEAPPSTRRVYSYSPTWFSTSNVDALGKAPVGSLVMLRGAMGKAQPPRPPAYPNYAVFLNVRTVELVVGVTIHDLYDAVQERTTRLSQCVQAAPSGGGGGGGEQHANAVVLRVRAAPDFEAIARERCMVTPRYTSDPETWKRKDAQQRDLPHAHLFFAVEQWEGDYEHAKDTGAVESFQVSAPVYEEQLGGFCITDVEAWRQFAPHAFPHTDYVLFGHLDPRSMETLGGGLGDDESVTALPMRVKFLLADVAGAYRRVGIPVTRDWAKQHCGFAVGGALDASKTPPSVVNLTDTAALGDRGGALHHPDTEFRVLINANINIYNQPKIGALSNSEGDELMRLLELPSYAAAGQDQHLPPEHAVYQLASSLQSNNAKFQLFALMKKHEPAQQQDGGAGRKQLCDENLRRFLEGEQQPAAATGAGAGARTGAGTGSGGMRLLAAGAAQNDGGGGGGGDKDEIDAANEAQDEQAAALANKKRAAPSTGQIQVLSRRRRE